MMEQEWCGRITQLVFPRHEGIFECCQPEGQSGEKEHQADHPVAHNVFGMQGATLLAKFGHQIRQHNGSKHPKQEPLLLQGVARLPCKLKDLLLGEVHLCVCQNVRDSD